MPRMNILNAVEREAFDSPPFSTVSNASSILTSPPRRFAAGLRSPAWRKPASCSSRTASLLELLYLSQKLEEIKDTASRDAFLDAVAMARRLPGSTSTCSASMTSRTRSLRDRIGIRPPNWWTK
jgi:hypothetical protein